MDLGGIAEGLAMEVGLYDVLTVQLGDTDSSHTSGTISPGQASSSASPSLRLATTVEDTAIEKSEEHGMIPLGSHAEDALSCDPPDEAIGQQVDGKQAREATAEG